MKVLLGIGASADPVGVLERTIERTREAGDDLTVAILDATGDVEHQAALERRARAAVEAAGLDGTVDVRRLADPAGPELVETAEREGFDRLVLGGGRRTPMGKVTFDDLAEYVLLNARVSVTLVR